MSKKVHSEGAGVNFTIGGEATKIEFKIAAKIKRD